MALVEVLEEMQEMVVMVYHHQLMAHQLVEQVVVQEVLMEVQINHQVQEVSQHQEEEMVVGVQKVELMELQTQVEVQVAEAY
jgi:hypothetical protein